MACYGRLFVLVFLFLLFVPSFASNSLRAGEEKLLVFGKIDEDPVKTIRDRQAFVDHIAKKLAPLGITGIRILVVDKMSLLGYSLFLIIILILLIFVLGYE